MNGDGRRDLSVTHHDYELSFNQAAVVFTPATAGDIDIASLNGSDGFVLENRNNPVEDAGDVNGDGFEDLTVPCSVVAMHSEAAILYGAAGGVPLRDTLDSYLSGEITCVVDKVSRGCLSACTLGQPRRPGWRRSARNSNHWPRGTASAAMLFGTDGNATRVCVRRCAAGRESQFALLGKPRELDISGPMSLVAEQVDEGWHVRWQPPVNGLVDSYRVLVDGEAVATLAASTTQFLLTQVNASPPFRIDVEALGANDTLIGTTIRQVAARYEDDLLSATVYGPTLVELIFDRQAPWDTRTMTYQVWRNCEFLTLAQENASGYWDSTAKPGQSYSYFLTPLYSRFNEVATPAALRDYPSLQRRSNSVTVVTPGGDANVEPTPLPCLNGASGETDDGDDGDASGDSDGNEESVKVHGLVISWQADGWHQVQDALDDYRSWCEGGYDCTVHPGTYVVINHHEC